VKTLLTCDLHFNLGWFEWLETKAPEFDLVVIAGDLLDMFAPIPQRLQIPAVQGALKSIAARTTLAICSGNHDTVGKEIKLDRAPVFEWLALLSKHRNLISDGCTRVFGDLIITTVPYACSREQKQIWLDRGAIIRRDRRCPWLVVHHVPPPLRNNPSREEGEALELINKYQPDFWLSGHLHDLPYLPGNTWHQRLGRTFVFIPGQLINVVEPTSAAFPNHIILDLDSRSVRWESTNNSATEGDVLDLRLFLPAK
jgi:predicted phosphodiesterase